MAEKFLLPCDSCGARTPIERRQAGSRLRCGCGTMLEVPTIRGLAQLEPAPDEERPATSNWGMGQGLIFLGVLACLFGGVLASYLYSRLPTIEPELKEIEKQVMNAQPALLFSLWQQYEQGLPRDPTMSTALLAKQTATLQNWISGGIAIFVVGAALIAGGLFTRGQGSGARGQ